MEGCEMKDEVNKKGGIEQGRIEKREQVVKGREGDKEEGREQNNID